MFDNLTIKNNEFGFRIDNWMEKGFTEERLIEIVKENQWIGVTISESARFKQFDDTNSLNLDDLVPCNNCTTWIHKPEGKRRKLTQDINFLGGTMKISKQPNQLPLTSFQIGERPCMEPSILTGKGFYKTEISQYEECLLEKATEEHFDPRYEPLLGDGVTWLTEWDILNGQKFGLAGSENQSEYYSVADMLYYLPAYDYYVDD